MKNKVYEKFEKEVQAHPDNRSLMVISDKLFSMCDNEAVCKKLLQENKTLVKSLERMKSEAKKSAVNGCACLSFEEGMDIIYKYFEINANSQTFGDNKQIQKKSIFDLI